MAMVPGIIRAVGGFCAGFFAYVAVGAAVGMFAGAALSMGPSFQDGPAAQLAWSIVLLPVFLLATMTLPLLDLVLRFVGLDPNVMSFAVIDPSMTIILVLSPIVIPALSAAGFFAWRTWSPVIAWALMLLFVADVALVCAVPLT